MDGDERSITMCRHGYERGWILGKLLRDDRFHVSKLNKRGCRRQTSPDGDRTGRLYREVQDIRWPKSDFKR
jgi:hypothetical protein